MSESEEVFEIAAGVYPPVPDEAVILVGSKLAEEPQMDPAFVEYRARINAEMARIALGAQPSVYYCPIAGFNGHVENGKFIRHGIPDGYEYDLQVWENHGKEGAAPLRKITPDPPKDCGCG